MRRVQSRMLLFLFALLAIAAAALLSDHFQNPSSIGQTVVRNLFVKDVTVQPRGFRFEIVKTAAAEQKGLSGRVTVPPNYGMLFVFEEDGSYGFWMKDMVVPIDIIWLSDKGEVVGIEDSVPTNSYPHVFYPPKPIRYVLETRAGEASAQGWSLGSIIPIPLQD